MALRDLRANAGLQVYQVQREDLDFRGTRDLLGQLDLLDLRADLGGRDFLD